MKRSIVEFLRRGVVAFGFGPLVLAVVYLIMQDHGMIVDIPVNQVCMGIFSLSALAFVAGGMNFVYQIEGLPLMAAIFIHGAVLYVSYLITYLVNDWLEMGRMPILAFTGIFVFGYLIIWAIIFLVMRNNTKRINEKLKQKQGNCKSNAGE